MTNHRRFYFIFQVISYISQPITVQFIKTLGNPPLAVQYFKYWSPRQKILVEFNKLFKWVGGYEVRRQNNTCIWALKILCMDNNECLWVQWYEYFHELTDLECSIQRGEAELNGTFKICQRMKIFVPLNEWKHSLFVLYNVQIDLCHLVGGLLGRYVWKI